MAWTWRSGKFPSAAVITLRYGTEGDHQVQMGNAFCDKMIGWVGTIIPNRHHWLICRQDYFLGTKLLWRFKNDFIIPKKHVIKWQTIWCDYCCDQTSCIGFQHVNQESQEIIALLRLLYRHTIHPGSKDCVTKPLSVCPGDCNHRSSSDT